MKPIIVFDLDGTLVDTAPDLLDSLNHSLAAGGAQSADTRGIRQFVGHGARVMIERAYVAQKRMLDAAEHDRLFALFLEHYGTNIPGQSKPYPGVPGALARLAGAGNLLAVCTNKTEEFSKRLLQGVGIAGHFTAICGSDTFAFRKPDPRHLLETIKLAGGDPRHAVMVGDSQTDIDTAKAARVPVVAVDFGYTDRHVREFSPSRIISHFDELTAAMCEDLMQAAQA
jgi:phosphoglycolate phosphatase